MSAGGVFASSTSSVTPRKIRRLRAPGTIYGVFSVFIIQMIFELLVIAILVLMLIVHFVTYLTLRTVTDNQCKIGNALEGRLKDLRLEMEKDH